MSPESHLLPEAESFVLRQLNSGFRGRFFDVASPADLTPFAKMLLNHGIIGYDRWRLADQGEMACGLTNEGKMSAEIIQAAKTFHKERTGTGLAEGEAFARVWFPDMASSMPTETDRFVAGLRLQMLLGGPIVPADVAESLAAEDRRVDTKKRAIWIGLTALLGVAVLLSIGAVG